jgi:hypothetical protein
MEVLELQEDAKKQLANSKSENTKELTACPSAK